MSETSNYKCDTRTVRFTPEACSVGDIRVGIHVMAAGRNEPTIAIDFGAGRLTGLRAAFHGSLSEMRSLVAALNQHIEVAAQAAAEQVGVSHYSAMAVQAEGGVA